MMLRTYKKGIVSLCVFSMLLLTGCSENVSPGAERVAGDFGEVYTLTDADTKLSADNAEEVVLGAEQTVYLIEEPGDYLLQGNWEGQVQIDVQDEIVHLILDNAEMESLSGPVVYVKSAAKVVITIPEGSSSILTDSTNYADFEDARSCIFSACDLTINGSGSLQVYGNYNDAIRTKDTLKILDVNLAVQAKDTGLRGNDGVVLLAENADIQCEGTGIYTEKENKPGKGFVDIAAGTVNIIAGEYGIQAAENVYIHECKADILGVVGDITCPGEQYIEEGCLE